MKTKNKTWHENERENEHEHKNATRKRTRKHTRTRKRTRTQTNTKMNTKMNTKTERENEHQHDNQRNRDWKSVRRWKRKRNPEQKNIKKRLYAYHTFFAFPGDRLTLSKPFSSLYRGATFLTKSVANNRTASSPDTSPVFLTCKLT